MRDGDHLVIFLGETAFHHLRGDRIPPPGLEDVHVQSLAFAEVDETVPEEAVRADEDVFPLPGDVGDGHLHGERAGTGHDEGFAAAFPQGLQVRHDLGEIGHEIGVAEGDGFPRHLVLDRPHDRGRAGDHHEFRGFQHPFHSLF